MFQSKFHSYIILGIAVAAPVINEAVVKITFSREIGKTLYVEHDTVTCHNVLLLLRIQSVCLFLALNHILF